MSAHVQNDYQENMPIGYCIVESERSDLAGEFFKTLQKLRPEAFRKLRIIASDLTLVYKKAWRENFDQSQVKFLSCAWHFEKALKLNVKSHEIYSAVRTLQLLADKENFGGLWNTFERNYYETKEGRYVVDQFGWKGIRSTPHSWSRSFNRGLTPHNLGPERFHAEAKRVISANMRLDDLISILQQLSRKYLNKGLFRELGLQNIRNSTAHQRFLDDHEKANLENYSILVLTDGSKFKITNKQNGHSYVMELMSNEIMPCIPEQCKIVCSKCSDFSYQFKNTTLCSHRIKCSCPVNVYSNMESFIFSKYFKNCVFLCYRF